MTLYTVQVQKNGKAFIKLENKTNVGSNDFIPITFLDTSYENNNIEYIENFGDPTELSSHLDADKKKQPLSAIKLKTNEIVQFKIKRGNKNADDTKGIVRGVTTGIKIITDEEEKKKDIKKLSDDSYEISFNEMFYLNKFKIKFSVENIKKDAYIDFYADPDDWFYKVKNVHCGRVAFTNSSKVGLRLTSNIESLPNAPAGYSSPPTFTEPDKSFNVANTYQNSGGMCFAVSMARVNKAYIDEHGIQVIEVKSSGNDYLYSGTIIKNIPDEYFGYGVGGALASNGYADLIDHDEVWAGELEEGAMIQYWNNYNEVSWSVLKQAIKNTLSGSNDDNFSGGHSVVFKGYIYGANGTISGIKYYDYVGLDRTFSVTDNKIFKGANLRDEKK